MDHGPAVELGVDHASAKKSKLGLILFAFYTIIYVGFVAINTIDPAIMETTVFMGQNLAIVYGMGLIILAIVMGLIYNHICTGYENEMNKEEK